MPNGNRLIAIEGIRAAELQQAGTSVLRALNLGKGEGALSLWDASGIFFELAREKTLHTVPSAKTLLLLYASDLVFRLRWQIQPALEEGYTVIAAPYVGSAMAFGAASGVPKDWMRNLFEFAPKPAATYRVEEKKTRQGWSGKRTAGFIEYGCATLGHLSESVSQTALRDGVLGYWDSLPKSKRVRELTSKQLKKLRDGGL